MRPSVKFAGALALVAAIPLLMAPTGGIPFFLQLGGLGVGAPPSASQGMAYFSTDGTHRPLLVNGQTLLKGSAIQGSGNALTVNGANSGTAAIIVDGGVSPATALVVDGGTSSTDTALSVGNHNNSSTFFKIDGAGNITAPSPASVPWANLPIQCATACSVTNIQVGQSAYIRKTATTSRSSTTTQTLDPDLQYTNIPIGTYLLEYSVGMEQAAAASGGISVSTGGTATVSSSLMDVVPSFLSTGTALTGTYGTTNGTTQCTGTAFATITGTNLPNTGPVLVQSRGSCAVSVAGGVGISWAQNTSSANATQVLQGSYATLTRIN